MLKCTPIIKVSQHFRIRRGLSYNVYLTSSASKCKSFYMIINSLLTVRSPFVTVFLKIFMAEAQNFRNTIIIGCGD